MKCFDSPRMLQLCLATTTLVVGLLLITTAFWVPPVGVIHPSILTAFGEMLTFVGAIVGIDYRYRTTAKGDVDARDRHS